MEEKNTGFGNETTDIVKIEDMTVDETQLAEQLYSSGGLDPIVDAGIKDYDKKIQGLKRVEIHWDRDDFPGEGATLQVELDSKSF